MRQKRATAGGKLALTDEERKRRNTNEGEGERPARAGTRPTGGVHLPRTGPGGAEQRGRGKAAKERGEGGRRGPGEQVRPKRSRAGRVSEATGTEAKAHQGQRRR